MYIVLGLNQDEFGRGISRPVYKFETEKQVWEFCARYNGDISRLEIFSAEKLTINLTLDKSVD
jgi:hypothetical protein